MHYLVHRLSSVTKGILWVATSPILVISLTCNNFQCQNPYLTLKRKNKPYFTLLFQVKKELLGKKEKKNLLIFNSVFYHFWREPNLVSSLPKTFTLLTSLIGLCSFLTQIIYKLPPWPLLPFQSSIWSLHSR